MVTPDDSRSALFGSGYAGLGKTNFVILKAAIDTRINAEVGRRGGERHEFTRAELDAIETRFATIVGSVVNELFHGEN
jgi:hypothetical protein